MVAITLALLAAAVLLALLFVARGGRPRRELHLRSRQEILERRDALEAQEVEQMLAALNARRRARREPVLSALEIELQVIAEELEQRRG